jgi:hypothetical protein
MTPWSRKNGRKLLVNRGDASRVDTVAVATTHRKVHMSIGRNEKIVTLATEAGDSVIPQVLSLLNAELVKRVGDAEMSNEVYEVTLEHATIKITQMFALLAGDLVNLFADIEDGLFSGNEAHTSIIRFAHVAALSIRRRLTCAPPHRVDRIGS